MPCSRIASGFPVSVDELSRFPFTGNTPVHAGDRARAVLAAAVPCQPADLQTGAVAHLQACFVHLVHITSPILANDFVGAGSSNFLQHQGDLVWPREFERAPYQPSIAV